MKKALVFALSLLIITSCIEPYTFDNKDVKPVLVVEGFISDVSYNESLLLPNDGRFFGIKLKYTSIVTNKYDDVIEDATVRLISDDGFYWNYTPTFFEDSFQYLLIDNDFHAEEGKSYKIQIILSNGETYESEFQSLEEIKPMGDISFEETEQTTTKYIAGEIELVTIKGINVFISIPESEIPASYRWDVLPSWVFIAPNARENSPDKICWVSNKYYLRDFVLAKDTKGGFKQKLAFIETSANERLGVEFTLFVRQQVLNEESFLFWNEVKDQSSAVGLFDPPPFNVRSNIKPVGNDNEAYGFFSVTRESAKRWYFTRAELSYNIDYDIFCITPPPPYEANYCLNCRAISTGISINSKPSWWR
jgi:hypothetical protein